MAATDIAELEAAGKQVIESLVDRTFGSTKVVDGWSHASLDHDDEQILYTTVVLNDPPGDTWPSDDMKALRTAFRNAVREADVGVIAVFTAMSQRDRREEQALSSDPEP